ncbi:kazrin-like isoform X1 [Dysidea avara]|uniref:kazrin-like isoform X1 n=2 Tax=Dysidea avara TaxID=196820 RepID=UPI0033185DB9
MHEFNKKSIVEQRENKEAANNVLYWTNKKMKQWLNQIDLQEYSENLTGTGVHGALVVLEQISFTSDSLAGMLNIPTSVPLVHKHLATELALLLSGRVEESISMAKTPRANTVGSSFTSSSQPLTHHDNTSVPALDLGDREAKTRWSFREPSGSVSSSGTSASKLPPSSEPSSSSIKHSGGSFTSSSNGSGSLRVSAEHHTGTGTTV